VEIGSYVVAEERKEGGYGECFVAIGYDLEVYRMPVEPEREERRSSIDWYHEQNSDNTRKVTIRISMGSEVQQKGKHTVFARTAWYNESHASLSNRETI
jgi:hypothetical protein